MKAGGGKMKKKKTVTWDGIRKRNAKRGKREEITMKQWRDSPNTDV